MQKIEFNRFDERHLGSELMLQLYKTNGINQYELIKNKYFEYEARYL